MKIYIRECKECPFCNYHSEDGGLFTIPQCMAPTTKYYSIYTYGNKVPHWCPLVTEKITIKLDQNS
jgi:hypothetical protein